MQLKQHKTSMASYFESVKQGNFSNAWVDTILNDLECPMAEGDVEEEASKK